MSKNKLLTNAKPILFNTEMVRAILDGRKVQTRRVVNLKTGFFKNALNIKIIEQIDSGGKKFRFKYDMPPSKDLVEDINKPKYKKDDILWIREPAKVIMSYDSIKEVKYQYGVDGVENQIKIPSRFLDEHMSFAHKKWLKKGGGIPNGCIKEMARIFLKVTNVRVERLQDIRGSYKDIVSEGLPEEINYSSSPKASMKNMIKWWTNLWNSTSKDGYKWEDNPYVFVYEFEVIDDL